MINDKVKFTVIIPTRERCDVLEWSLRSITAQKYSNLEIIVSDNFSQDDTKKVVDSFSDARIRYLNTGKRVSMSKNWEFALSHVSEGWVTILGDDDALLPNSLEKVSILINKTNIKMIRSSVCSYAWPSPKEKRGMLRIPTENSWEKRNASEWLAKAMTGKANYTELPMLYNGGFVDFSILKKIKEEMGFFYSSCIPDVYSACSISSVLDEYIYSFEPFAVNGASKHSNGSDAFSLKKKNADSPSIIFKNEPNIPLHDAIPLDAKLNYPASIQALLYESYLQTEKLRKNSEFINHQYQLELILATASIIQNKPVESWAVIFSEKHGLNIEECKIRAEKIKKKFVLKYRVNRILSIFKHFYLDSSFLSINNSYEASIISAVIISVKPSKLKYIAGLLKTIK